MTFLKRMAVALTLILTTLILTAGPASAHRVQKPVQNERQIAIVGFIPNADQSVVLRQWASSRYVHLFSAPSCEGQRFCIVLSEESLGPRLAGYGTYGYEEGYAGVAVVNSDIKDRRVRRQVLCHEIGHNLFLEHASGCMNAVATGRSTSPNGRNLNTAR